METVHQDQNAESQEKEDKQSELMRKAHELYHGYLYHMRYTLACSELKLNKQERYMSFALALRDCIAGRWMDTQDAYHLKKTKRVYYLSMEFLIGRLLGNNAINLKMDDVCAKALEDQEMNWSEMKEFEHDAGLGNGGLGRLAACFMNSMATLQLPCQGYGLRYDYGIFKQKIVNGMQVEEPDNWRKDGYPWEVKRAAYTAHVSFGGECRQLDINGKKSWIWIPAEHVCGIPYDIPIVGYGAKSINNLRLWSAVANNEFSFQQFNEGSYLDAVYNKVTAENLTKVLYPNDNIAQGKELRLRQQYFFVACTLHDIIRRFKTENSDLENLPDKVFMQLNDTHPTLAIPELMRILMDEEKMDYDTAWGIVSSCFGYTNHTILPEAMEKWPVELFRKLLPRHLQIIYDINSHFLEHVSLHFPGDIIRLQAMSIFEEGRKQYIRMANLAIIGSKVVNGVAKIHSDILREVTFKNFAELWPDHFQNKTNGITQRRWLRLANPRLSQLITSRIGEDWIVDLRQLRKLEEYIDDKEFLQSLLQVKKANKQNLADYIYKTEKIMVDVDSLFDVQVKRLHEYKRQLLLVMYIIIVYNRLLKNPDYDFQPRTFIFAAKAAPGYDVAKQIIKLIHSVAKVINVSDVVKGKIKIVFLPDFRVSLAEKIIPAAEVSEQISLAGTEASGTGNMKLMLNGALTLGTMDGANVEIFEEVGKDNIFTFGMTKEEVAAKRKSYSPWDIYHQNTEIFAAIESIRSNVFSTLNPGEFDSIVRSMLDFGDHYMILQDLVDYMKMQDLVVVNYQQPMLWAKKSLINIARSGKFSSDRTVHEYAKDIWHIEPFDVDKNLESMEEKLTYRKENLTYRKEILR